MCPTRCWGDGGVKLHRIHTLSIRLILGPDAQYRFTALYRVRGLVILQSHIGFGARMCAHVYTACSILLRRCARIRIVRIFFLFISAAVSLFNGSWNGAYLHTLFKYSPLKYPHSAYICIHTCKSNAYMRIVCVYIYRSSFWLKFKAFIAMSENVDVGYIYIYI